MFSGVSYSEDTEMIRIGRDDFPATGSALSKWQHRLSQARYRECVSSNAPDEIPLGLASASRSQSSEPPELSTNRQGSWHWVNAGCVPTTSPRASVVRQPY